MLKINVPHTELYDESRGFIQVQAATLILEHSLLSMSKWESEFHKPFFSPGRKTDSETIAYVKAMTINQVDDNTYLALTPYNIKSILDYINNPMSATKLNDKKQKNSRDIITTEGIYYLLSQQGIPFEVEKWHFNRLLALLNIADRQNQPEQKMSQTDLAQKMHELNEERKAKLGTTG